MNEKRPSAARIAAAIRAASPTGRLEAHEAFLGDSELMQAAEAGGLDLTGWRWQVKAARNKLERGNIDSARAHIAAADREFLTLTHLLDPVRDTGKRQRATLDAQREAAHAKQREAVQIRRKAIAAMLCDTNPNLTGGALEEILRKRLLDRFGIKASTRTIRRDLAEISPPD